MYLTYREIEVINSVSKNHYNSADDIKNLSKEEILNLTDLLGDLIGYDPMKEDIDALGLESDNIISKLLKLLEQRGEM